MSQSNFLQLAVQTLLGDPEVKDALVKYIQGHTPRPEYWAEVYRHTGQLVRRWDELPRGYGEELPHVVLAVRAYYSQFGHTGRVIYFMLPESMAKLTSDDRRWQGDIPEIDPYKPYPLPPPRMGVNLILDEPMLADHYAQVIDYANNHWQRAHLKFLAETAEIGKNPDL